jgi:hypothetical protein
MEGMSFNVGLPSIKDFRIHFVQLIEACKYKFIFREAIIRSLVLARWIQHIQIFLKAIVVVLNIHFR